MILKINNIFEDEDVIDYLNSRQLIKQYKKVKEYLKQGNFAQIKFKERSPKKCGIWYFRINKKYRAIGYFDNNDFIVSKIDDHQ
jgi:plasmid maintenance system killer protein